MVYNNIKKWFKNKTEHIFRMWDKNCEDGTYGCDYLIDSIIVLPNKDIILEIHSVDITTVNNIYYIEESNMIEYKELNKIILNDVTELYEGYKLLKR